MTASGPRRRPRAGVLVAAAARGRCVYAQLLTDRRADGFLTYCTNATQAVRERPSLRVVSLPPPLAAADYGLAVLTAGHRARADRLVSFILSPEGQAILARHGFAAPTAPGG